MTGFDVVIDSMIYWLKKMFFALSRWISTSNVILSIRCDQWDFKVSKTILLIKISCLSKFKEGRKERWNVKEC